MGDTNQTTTTTTSQNTQSTPIPTQSSFLHSKTLSFLQQYYPNITLSDLADDNVVEQFVAEFMDSLRSQITIQNASISDKADRFSVPKDLPRESAGDILLSTGDFRCVRLASDGGTPILVMRVRSGKDIGTWAIIGDTSSSTKPLNVYLRRLYPGYEDKYRKEIRSYLYDHAEIVDVDDDSNVVFCQNGVYDYYRRDANLNPFTSYDDPTFWDLYGNRIRLTKLDTPYDPNATDPVYRSADGFEWSVEYHLASPFSDDISAKLWLEISHFAVRGSSGGKAWWLTNAAEGSQGKGQGGNGKSSLMEFLVHTIGKDKVLGTSMEHLGDKYALSGLANKIAIINGETDANQKTMQNCRIYKSLARGESVTVEAKFETPYDMVFHGAMLQGMNGIAKASDQTESFYRKLEILRCDTEFTNDGVNRDYIKEDYIRRLDARKYYLKKLLEMPCLQTYTKEYIDAIAQNKAFVRQQSTPVFEFMDEYTANDDEDIDFAAVDRIPNELLWDCFQVWESEMKYHYQQDKKQFMSDLRSWLRMNHEWAEGKTSKLPSGNTECNRALALRTRQYANRGSYEARANVARWLGNSDDTLSAFAHGQARRSPIVRVASATKIPSSDDVKAQKEAYQSYLAYCGWWVHANMKILAKGEYTDAFSKVHKISIKDLPTQEQWENMVDKYHNTSIYDAVLKDGDLSLIMFDKKGHPTCINDTTFEMDKED